MQPLRIDINAVISLLKKAVKKYRQPIVSRVALKKDPFRVLISTIISLRTKDAVTETASARLFALAHTPERMLSLSRARIASAIYPAGFYRTKALNILSVCKVLITKYAGKVPDSLDELLQLQGVGRKTANLVLTLGYGKPGICVDTHVHRISNRLGYVRTRTPEETEFRLRAILPRRHWIIYNDLLVTYGQNVCKPVKPLCDICVIYDHCRRVGI